MKKITTIITVIVILIMIIMNFLILYLMIDIKINMKSDIGNSVSKSIESTNIPKIVNDEVVKELDGLNIGVKINESVDKKIDSINIHNGTDGKDSISTNTIQKTTETVVKQIPVNGKSAYDIAVENGFSGTEQEWLESLKIKYYQRCNTIKNRWEYRYNEFESWKLLNNESVHCLGVE